MLWLFHVPATCHLQTSKSQLSLHALGSHPPPYVPIPLASFKHDKLRNKALGKRDSTGWRGQLKGQIQSVSHLGISLFFSRIPQSIISLIEPNGSQLWVIFFPSRGPFGNVCRHFWLSQQCVWGGGGGCSSTLWVETRDAAKHPAKHRTTPTPGHLGGSVS